MEAGAQVPGCPRPVAGLPPLDAAGIARAWLLALIAGRPLERAADLPVAEVAADGPRVVRSLVAALTGADALALLEREGPAVARLCAAAGPGEAVEAVEALRRALDAALREVAPDRADGAGGRLAHCCARLAAAAVAPPAVADPEARAAARLAAQPVPAAVIALEADGEAAAPPEVPEACAVVAAGPRRWFVVGPELGARALAERLAAALPGHAGLATRRSTEDPAGVVAAADEALFAARAQGVPVA